MMETVLLRVAEHGGEYRVELRRRTAGGCWSSEPSAVEPIPLDLGPAPAPVPGPEICAAIRAHVRDNRQSGTFDAIGEYLAGLLLRGAVRQEWDGLHQHGAGLRTLLQVEPENLRRLPWELMSRNQQLLFVDDANPMARVRAIDSEAAPGQLLPVRMLVVEGQRDDTLDTEAEVRAIKRALANCGGRIDAEFLTAPGRDLFIQTYERVRPHVFHFIGHGVREPGSDEPALRVFDGQKREFWLLTRGYFLNLLRPAPRLAVLNACRSGDGAGDDKLATALRDFTETLLTKGAAAVVGMQADVQGAAAARFGGALYHALAQKKPIDVAVARARREVYLEVGVNQERDWFLPSLTLRVEPEHVLPTPCPPGPPGRDIFVDQMLTPQFTQFVDRVKERHQVVAGIDPERGAPARLLVVSGGAGFGKTHLLQWVRRRCALRGVRVRYVDFDGRSTIPFHHALCDIRDTEEDVPAFGHGAAAGLPFRQFDYELPFLARGVLPEVRPEQPPPADPPRPESFQPGQVGLIERTFETFLGALHQATETSPMVLILDHLDRLDDGGFRNMIFPFLIRRIATTPDVPNLRLIVVQTASHQHVWPEDSAALGTRVPVNLSEPAEFAELFDDFALALGPDLEPKAVQLRDGLVGLYNHRWPMKVFKNVRELVEGAQ